jgi:hypothetical protein
MGRDYADTHAKRKSTGSRPGISAQGDRRYVRGPGGATEDRRRGCSQDEEMSFPSLAVMAVDRETPGVVLVRFERQPRREADGHLHTTEHLLGNDHTWQLWAVDQRDLRDPKRVRLTVRRLHLDRSACGLVAEFKRDGALFSRISAGDVDDRHDTLWRRVSIRCPTSQGESGTDRIDLAGAVDADVIAYKNDGAGFFEDAHSPVSGGRGVEHLLAVRGQCVPTNGGHDGDEYGTRR